MGDQFDLFGEPVLSLPGLKSDASGPGSDRGKILPGPVGSVIVTGDRGKVPRSPPVTGERPGPPVTIHTLPSGDSGEEERDLKTGLAMALDALASWALVVANFDKRLAPYWDQKNRLNDAVVNTHGEIVAKNGARMLRYNRPGQGIRKNLFVALDALAIEYGPTLNERRDAAREMNLLGKEVEHIKKRLDQIRKRKERKNGKAA